MADRKPTVLNPAGYQENLQDTDNLIVEAAPTANNHAVNKEFVDDLKLVIDGDIAAAGKWEESNGNLYPKTLTNNVGIGTDSPSSMLEVSGATPQIKSTDTDVSNSYSVFQNSSGLSVYNAVNNGGAGQHLFQANGSEKMRIDSSGNVGIGTDSPIATLDVVKDTGPDPQVSIRSGQSAKDGILGFPLAGDCKASIITNKHLTFHTNATTNAANERVRITDQGNVGIGTDSPSGKLDVQTGNNERVVFDSAGSTSPRISLTRDTGSNYNFVNDLGVYRFYKNETIELYRYTSDNHIWSTEASGEVARFSSNGNVGIGTSSPAPEKLALRESFVTFIVQITSTQRFTSQTADLEQVPMME